LKGMNIALIVVALQLAVILVSVFRGRSEDPRFAGDKIGFRS